MKHNDWTEQLRERLADFQVDVPEEWWDGIEQRLPKKNAVVAPLWKRWLSVAAMAAMVLQITMQKPGAILRESAQEQQIPQQVAQHIQRQRQPAKIERIPHQEEQEQYERQEEPERQKPQELQEPQEEQVIQEQQEPQSAQGSEQGGSPLMHVIEKEQLPVVMVIPSVQKHRMLSIGLMASNGMISYNHANGVMMSTEKASNFDFSNYLPVSSAPALEPIWLSGYEERQHHDHPISFGLTVSYPLTQRWSIGTGLVYTRLTSQFINTMKYTTITTDQRLQYVGVPVNIQYQLLKGKQWRVYASAVAQADWNVRAEHNREGVDIEAKKDDVQWSLGGTLGVEYRFIPQLGLYAEPGVRYYFDNGSNVQNFFKDVPTSWSLQFGVHLHLGQSK